MLIAEKQRWEACILCVFILTFMYFSGQVVVTFPFQQEFGERPKKKLMGTNLQFPVIFSLESILAPCGFHKKLCSQEMEEYS